MTLRRILVALLVVAAVGLLAWQFNLRHGGSAIVVRYAEPPAQGEGSLGLISCEVRVEDAHGAVLAARDIPANPQGSTQRTVRLELASKQLALAQRVRADCTDAAGRTGKAASYALAPSRKPLTRMASEKR